MSTTTEKQRLLMISDLWGWNTSKWVDSHLTILSRDFEIVLYDSQVLGNITFTEISKDKIHNAFLNGGIDIAAKTLVEKEDSESPAVLLAFSIGATIAWRAMLEGLKVKELVAVSGTRLRYETSKPKGSIKLFFGEEDIYVPGNDWFNSLQLPKYLVSQRGHDLYKDKEFCTFIAAELPSK